MPFSLSFSSKSPIRYTLLPLSVSHWSFYSFYLLIFVLHLVLSSKLWILYSIMSGLELILSQFLKNSINFFTSRTFNSSFKAYTWLCFSLPVLVSQFLFSLYLFIYWSIIDLQCCVSFSYTAKWFRYIYVYILFYYRLL